MSNQCSRKISVSEGGTGGDLLVLIHGLGANKQVWNPLLPYVERGWPGRWLIPDLRGHGKSFFEGPYGCGNHASDVAEVLRSRRPTSITIIGHSFGGVVATALASGWFGDTPQEVFAIGVKADWSEAERAGLETRALVPPRVFKTAEEAIERYLKLSGLAGLAETGSAEAASGVYSTDAGFFISFDNASFFDAIPDWGSLVQAAQCPLHLAAGENDPMTNLDQMRRFDDEAKVISLAAHNAHWEEPSQVWDWVRSKSVVLKRPL